MMYRIRVGLIGLGSVFLLVMLSAALLRLASQGPTGGNGSIAAENDSTPAEPLAQLGVAPGNPQADEQANLVAHATAAAPAKTAATRR